MKKITVLIDFTEGSRIALMQAVALAQKTHAEVVALHIVASQDKQQKAEVELTEFLAKNTNYKIEIFVSVGALALATETALKKISPDIVMVCTHGVKGMFQHLFGAQILKLVQGINYPCLVVHENTKLDLCTTKSILFPIGPHPEFNIKIKQTTQLAKALNASVVVYEIDRPKAEFQDLLTKNCESAKNYFTEHGVPYNCVLEDVEVLSVGYYRQTINYANNNNIHIISLMADISKNDKLFGFGDKENFLVNEQGISIYTCNT